MTIPQDAWLAVLTWAISVLGLLALLACRMGERSRQIGHLQFFFLLNLGSVALITLTSLAAHSTDWLISGTTLCCMVVGATIDCGQWQRAGSC
jgi:hypothetical protein